MASQNEEEGFMNVLAENRVGAQLGDRVRFEMPDTSFVVLSLLFYLVPLIIGLIFLFISLKIFTAMGVGSSEVISAILSLIVFGISLYVINKKKLFKVNKDAYKIIAYELLSEKEEE